MDSALALFQEILEHQLKFSFEPNSNKSVGATWHNVGVIHMKMGSLNDAYNAMKEAVRIRLASLGATHLDVAVRYFLFCVSIFVRMNRWEANILHNIVSSVLRRQASRVNLGSVQLSLKMYSEADISFREALRVRRMVLGGKDGIMHPEIAQVLSHLGLLYYECGEFMAAIGSFEEVLYIQRACQKKHYRNTSDMVSDQQFVRVNLSIAETLVNIGTIRSKRNQYSQACNVLEEAASVSRTDL